MTPVRLLAPPHPAPDNTSAPAARDSNLSLISPAPKQAQPVSLPLPVNGMSQPADAHDSPLHSAQIPPHSPVSPKVKAATAALTVGASKAEVIEKLLETEKRPNALQRAIRQFLPSWWPAPSPSDKGAPIQSLASSRSGSPSRSKSPSRSNPPSRSNSARVAEILDTFKATRMSETPKVVPGMLDALRFFKDNNAHVIFCTNASALKVSQEWASIVRSHWQNLTGLQVTDDKKLTHIYHSNGNLKDCAALEQAEHQAPDWDTIWKNMSDGIKTDRSTEGFRIDIMGKCGKGKLPAAYPAISPDVHLNPSNLEKLGVTRSDTLFFVGNELKDAAAARYLADEGFSVQFYFLNSSNLDEAITYLEQHLATQAADHPDHEELSTLLAHCKRWDLAHWPQAQRVEDGHELMRAIAPTLASASRPKILTDFHGTISDQIQTLNDLVEAGPPAKATRNH